MTFEPQNHIGTLWSLVMSGRSRLHPVRDKCRRSWITWESLSFRILRVCVSVLVILIMSPARGAETAAPKPSIDDFLLTREFPRNSVPFAYSPDGKWLAFVVCRQDEVDGLDSGTYRHLATGIPRDVRGCAVNLKDRHSGATRVISSGNSYGPVWSAKGNDLAYYSDEGGVARLWIFNSQTGGRHFASSLIVHPRSADDVPIWSPDGEYIFASAIPVGMTLAQAQSAFEDAPSRVTNREKNVVTAVVFSTGAKSGAGSARLVNDLPSNLAQTSDLVRIEIRTGSVERLLGRVRIDGLRLSPDGRYISFASGFGYINQSTDQKTYKLQVLDLKTLQLRVLVEDWRTNAGSGYSWSPNGRHIAVLDFDIKGGREGEGSGRCRIFSALGTLEADSDSESAFIYDFTGPAWTVDSTKLWLKTDHDVVEYSVGSHSFRSVVHLEGRSILALVAARDFQASGDDDKVLAIARDEQTKLLYVLSVSSDGRTEVGPPKRISIDNFTHQPEVDVDILPSRREFAAVVEGVDRPFDVLVFDVAKLSPLRFDTEVNPRFSNVHLGSSRLLSWRGIHGERMRGALLLPPQWDGAQTIPAVVVQYPNAFFSSSLYTFGLNTRYMNWGILALQGIAVFAIDLPVNSYKIKEVSEQLDTAVTALGKTEIVDSTRVGLYGCSQGAYTVVAGIEGTNRFKAAVADSPVQTDLIGVYLQVGERGENGASAWAEHGYANMGAPLFDDKQVYVENSPTLQLDKIHTPLLIVKGTNDSGVYMGDELFGGLQLLGREAKYIKYLGGGHCFGEFGYANDRDYVQQVLDWFRSHL
jgi:dipeptidyl aminopeptidase/acylaminoacyl peptidase